MPVLKTSEVNFESDIMMLRLKRKLSIQLVMLLSIFRFLRLCNSLVCNTLSKISVMFSNNIVTIFFLSHAACIVFSSI